MNTLKIGAVILTAQILIIGLGIKMVFDARKDETDPTMGYIITVLGFLISAGPLFERIGDKLN
jgi:hypothetical protein